MRSTGLVWAQVQVEHVPGSAPVSGSGSGLVSVGLMEVVGSASHRNLENWTTVCQFPAKRRDSGAPGGAGRRRGRLNVLINALSSFS